MIRYANYTCSTSIYTFVLKGIDFGAFTLGANISPPSRHVWVDDFSFACFVGYVIVSWRVHTVDGSEIHEIRLNTWDVQA